MKEDEKGYIVVETLGTFIPLVLLVVSILSLVNIVTLQARVHYALTQAANTLSMYSYTLEVTGISNDLIKLSEKSKIVTDEADALKKDINGVIDGISLLTKGNASEHGIAAINRVNGWGEEIVNNPKDFIQDLMNYGLKEGYNKSFGDLVKPLVGRYLSNGNMTGDEYLKSVNVIDGLNGLEFYGFDLFNLNSTGENDSILIDENGDIKLVVRYEIEYKFGSLPLPFEPKLAVTQVVKTKAWLKGSGEGYW